MSGRRSRDEGARVEREMVAQHRDLGAPCEGVPLSGAAGGSTPLVVMPWDIYAALVRVRGGRHTSKEGGGP